MIQSLRNVRPLYVLPADPLAEEVLIPGFQRAQTVNCMIGFFSSEALASLAPGLATYITATRNSLRLIVNPILRSGDLAAIQEGLRSNDAIATDILDDLFLAEDLLQRHTLTCLSWLIRTGRVEIKVALMENALFHLKVWLFNAPDGTLVVHGSSNATAAGLRKNVEQVAVSQSWVDSNQRYVAAKLQAQFDRFWNDDEDNCLVVDMPRAIRDRLVQSYRTDAPPTEADLNALYRRASGRENMLRDSELPTIRPRPVRRTPSSSYRHWTFCASRPCGQCLVRRPVSRCTGDGNRLRQNHRGIDLRPPSLPGLQATTRRSRRPLPSAGPAVVR